MTTLLTVALAALLAGADPGFDTVFLQNGGRLRGTVVEEDPTRGVTVQIPGGQVRTVPPGEIFRIEYRDGTIGAIGAQPAPPKPTAAPAAEPAPPAAPAPAEAPPPPAEPAPRAAPPPPPPGWAGHPPAGPFLPLNPGAMRPPPVARPSLFMLAGSLGVAVPGGEAEPGLDMSDFTSTQFLLGLEGGLRLSPELMLGLYMDIGLGDSRGPLREFCRFNGTDCTTADVRIGLMVRYAFTPLARETAWVGLGTGLDVLVASPDDSGLDGPAYGGWEPLRLSVGYDFRGSGQAGIGLFLTVGVGRYTEVDDGDGAGFVSLPSTSTHSWAQAGVRFILGP